MRITDSTMAASRARSRHHMILTTCGMLVLMIHKEVWAFNVDVELPTVYMAGTERATNHDRPEPRSMFGFSIAQHITHQGDFRILVGAPRANTTQPGVTEGGAVFTCEVIRGVGGAISCRVMTFDVSGNDRDDLGDGMGPQPIEDKSGQWFGATVSSSRNASIGDAMACAPHYIYFSTNMDKRLPIGNCYLFRGSQNEVERFNPIKSSVDRYTRRNPTSYEQFTQEGKAMFGMSGALSRDGNTMLGGAVGSFSWKGRLYAYTDLERNPTNPTRTASRPFEDHLFSYSYMTYAVALGNFSDSPRADYLVSAPRGGGLVPRGHDVLSGTLRIFDSSLKPFEITIGEEMGDYLGSSLAVGDFNGDGLDDLAAGAPYYAQKGSTPDTGRVLLMHQRPTGMSYRRKHIEGLRRWRERFGFSLATLGDINNDGFTDLAVGAPNGGSNGQGAVYIFHGSSQGIKSKFSQVIDAAQISNRLQTFGYSLSCGMDMDGNGYPDITVGGYSSDSIVQLWTKPVVRVYVNLTVPASIDVNKPSLTLPDGAQVTSFPVGLHQRHEGKIPASRIYLNITVRLDADRNAAPRAYFNAPGGRTTTYRIEGLPIHNAQGESAIHLPYPAYIKAGLRDKLTPIVVEMNYDVTVEVDYGLSEVLDVNIPTTVRSEMYIEKNCGEDRVCVADLRVDARSLTDEFILGKSAIEVQVQVNNTAEDDAFESQVSVQLPQGTTYSGFKQIKSPVTVRCSPRNLHQGDPADGNVGVETVLCEIGNPLPGNSEVVFNLRLDAKNFDGSVDYLAIYLNASSTNPENDTTQGDNTAEVTIPVRAVTPIRLSGISKPEQVLFLPNDSSSSQKKLVDNKIIHLYELRNLGPSTIGNASLEIYWPSRFEGDDGDDLFVLTEPPNVKQGNLIRPCTIVSNPYPTENTTDVNSRPKRNTQTFTEKYTEKEVVNKVVRCTSRGKEPWCSIINCDVSTLGSDQQALVEVNARLSATSLMQLPHMTILVSSEAVAKVESVPYAGVPAEVSVKSHRVDTILATKGVIQTGVKIWVIGISIAGGILLLLLLIFIMYKCGFFKRSIYEEEGMLSSVDDDNKTTADEDYDDEEDDMFPEGQAGNRNSRIDTVNRKLIFQNGISISIEDKR